MRTELTDKQNKAVNILTHQSITGTSFGLKSIQIIKKIINSHVKSERYHSLSIIAIIEFDNTLIGL